MLQNQTRPSQTLRIDVLPHFGDDPGGQPRTSGPALVSQDHGVLSADDFRLLFLNGYDATLITDCNGLVQESNLRATEILGYPGDVLQGQSILAAISGAEDSLLETIRTTLAAERFVRISAWCKRADGVFFAAEIAVNKLETVKGLRLCFFLRDETRRKRAEEELNTTHNAMRNAGTGIAVGALDGRLIYVNPALCRLWRQPSAEELLSQPLPNLLSDACAAAAVIEAVNNGREWEGEVLVRPTPGEELWVQAQAAPNFDSDNQLIGMVLSFVDISDRKRVEQTKRDVERDRVMMESLGAVCHHLGQPATVLLSSIELMARTRDPAVLDELMKMSAEAANLLRQTLHELNDLRSYRAVPYLKTAPADTLGGSIIDLQANSGNLVR
jgi:PAS domain S-box-containing protein